MKILVYFLMVMLSALTACPDKESRNLKQLQAEAPVIIYKTANDYKDKVPVLMNEDKTLIVAFPSPGDLYFEGKLCLPVDLGNGYLLDNRGLSPNAVFLDITYKEYAALEKTPDPEELMKRILDKEPFTEMYHCGSRMDFKDLRKELKRMVKANFEGCKRLK